MYANRHTPQDCLPYFRARLRRESRFRDAEHSFFRGLELCEDVSDLTRGDISPVGQSEV